MEPKDNREQNRITQLTEEDAFKAKLEAVMKARARQQAAAKLAAEKKAEEERLLREREEAKRKQADELHKKAIAAAYLRYIKAKKNDPEETATEELIEGPDAGKQQEKPAAAVIDRQKPSERRYHYTEKEQSRFARAITSAFAAPIYLHDRIQGGIDNACRNAFRGTMQEFHRITSSYRLSRRQIGNTFLAVCVMCAVVLIAFDRNTVYEYAYNGKVMGYVEAQEDVTNVLEIAGDKLNEVNVDQNTEDISFSTGDNISFKLVEASGKDTDDVDTTVNKLAYMTDIEVEAFGIYDGNQLKTIVKNQKSAEGLLSQVKGVLGTPDEGMEVVSVDFKKPLDIRPIKILLTSVQSNSAALEQMTKGGEVRFFHLVEQGETLGEIASAFGVAKGEIYDETNENVVKTIDAGDKLCIRKTVEPVSVELVEKGKMKEIIPYETIRKDSKDYYIGDEIVDVKGVDGVQIFSGTLTKVGGEITNRETDSLEVITKKVDEVILVGITKRPKTAPTGIFKKPVMNYVITDGVGPRWGSTHRGVDMGAPWGTSIYASDGGTVVRASWYSTFGNCIEIDHGNGYLTRYGHLSYIDVGVGDKVYQGQYIGDVGSTGWSTGPHLHFEIWHGGSYLDPEVEVQGGL